MTTVDILNEDFKDLPLSWQEENSAAATVVVTAIVSAYEVGGMEALDKVFVEQTAVLVHDEWRQRRKDKKEWKYVPENQRCDFDKLSPEEKDKDRNQVKKGIELFEQQMNAIKKALTMPK